MAEPITAPTAPVPVAPAAPPGRPESFADAMRRHGGFDPPPEAASADEPGEEEAPAAPAGERPRDAKGHFLPEKTKPTAAAKTPAAPAARPVVVTPPGADKLTQLNEIAKELGLVVENGRISTAERAEFRRHKMEQKAKLEAREAELNQKDSKLTTEQKARIERAEAIARAADDGDYDGLAKLLSAKDWNDLQRAVVERLADPNYKKLRELEQWKAEQSQREQQRIQELERQQAETAKQAAISNHINALSVEMKGSKDPVVAAFHDDPVVLGAIFRIQEEQYDGERTVSAAQALRMSAKGARMTLIDELRSYYDRGNRAFGAPAAPAALQEPAAATPAAPAAPAAPNMKRPAPKSQVVPSGNSVEPAPKRPFKDDREYSKHFTTRLAEAAEAERREEEEKRRMVNGGR